VGIKVFKFSQFQRSCAIGKEGWHYGSCERGYLFMGRGGGRGGSRVFFIPLFPKGLFISQGLEYLLMFCM